MFKPFFSTFSSQFQNHNFNFLKTFETFFPPFTRTMLRYLLVFGLPLVAPKPNLLSTHDNVLLDEDKSLEEYALLQRNAKRYRNAGKRRGELNTENLEDISPGLNRFLKNNTDVESDLPHWKQQLLRMQAENDFLSEMDKFERGTFSLQMFRENVVLSEKKAPAG